MKLKTIFSLLLIAIMLPTAADAQLNKLRLLSGVGKLVQAATLSDAQMAQYVSEYISQSDSVNNVLPAKDPLSLRLNKLTSGLTEVDGIALNFKVYDVTDVNAFACPDGSVRVYAGLMKVMDDDELLGVIGHEIGHIAHRDSKNAFKRSLTTAAIKDGLASTGSRMSALTDSQLSALGESLMTARFSQKQEKAADDYGYDFLKDHGKNPRAMAKSFVKLKELQGGDSAPKSSKINQLFSSHPYLDERIRRMQNRADEDNCPR